MQILLTRQFLNADDTPAVAADTKKPVDLRWALTQICLNDLDGNGQPLRGEPKIRRYELYRKIKKAGDVVELTAEDISHLKEGALAFSTLVAGQTREFLEITYVPPVVAAEAPPPEPTP